MRKVRCVSPHGGCHHGQRADNGLPAREGWKGRLQLEPHEGGYVDNVTLGVVPVGAVVDAPEPPGFIADGFHFVDDATGKGDVCASIGDDCWCGVHREMTTPPGEAPPPVPPRPAAPPPRPAATPPAPAAPAATPAAGGK